MSYEQQRAWEDRDRQHRMALVDAEYEADRVREESVRSTQSARARVQGLQAERDELAEESGQLAEQLLEVRRQLATIKAWLTTTDQHQTLQTWVDRRQAERLQAIDAEGEG